MWSLTPTHIWIDHKVSTTWTDSTVATEMLLPNIVDSMQSILHKIMYKYMPLWKYLIAKYLVTKNNIKCWQSHLLPLPSVLLVPSYMSLFGATATLAPCRPSCHVGYGYIGQLLLINNLTSEQIWKPLWSLCVVIVALRSLKNIKA